MSPISKLVMLASYLFSAVSVRRPAHLSQRYLSFLSSRFSTKMLIASACERNKQPILTVLSPYLQVVSSPLLVEVAAGTGQHMLHIASQFPSLRYLPTDVTEDHLRSIGAYAETLQNTSVCPPVYLDIAYEWKDQTHNQDFSKALRSVLGSRASTSSEIGLVDFVLGRTALVG
eukprot:GHVS01098876.1.p1 GENE.GHVS01098876.1~~GHVS01098876.1.p1  ORF type:complete len:173 (+),score=21.01 GHVS01098876.1:75-593(+)